MSLTYSGGTGENSEVLLISSVRLDKVHNEPMKESGRTQQLCHLWAGKSSWSFISVLLGHFYSYILLNLTRELLKLMLQSGIGTASPAQPPSCSCPGSRGAQVREGGSGWAHLEDVKRDPLTEPKQDRPTKTGMTQDMTPK